MVLMIPAFESPNLMILPTSGGYVILFGIATYAMRHSRNRFRHIRFDFLALNALFLVGTIVIICDLVGSAGSFYNHFLNNGIKSSMTLVQGRTFNHLMMCVSFVLLSFARY